MVKSTRVVVLSAVLLLVLLTGLMIPKLGTAGATTYSINKVKSGLVVSDALTTGNTASWTFGGTATLQNYFEDSQGLHIGIQAPQKDHWVNYYAHLPQPNAYLFHAVLTIPYNSVGDGVFNTGLYVEGSDFIPHVACEAYADSTGYYWDVEQSSDAGATYTILYISQPSSMPQTQDCTIITNGSNYLKVYIGGNLVFSSTTMNLGMSTPFIAFVQDDTSSASSMHYGIYSDYYVTANEKIKVTNNPSNAVSVKVLDSSNKVLASSSVVSGTATLGVGKYHFPLSGTINVYDSSGSIIASSPASMYGGDVFSVTTSAGPPAAPTNLSATVVSSSQINLSWAVPTDNGGSPITGYKIERSTNSGSTWSVLVSNTGSTATTYSNTGLSPSTTYSYRVSAINSVGTSSPSNTASSTTSQPPITPIKLVQSGLVSSDPLNNETKTQQELLANQQFWTYGGDAIAEKAPYDFYKDTQGLHIGVQAPANGTWAGFYAVSPNTNAALFHTVITTPVSSIPYQWYENGLYVQTSQPFINYVSCFSSTSVFGTVWSVGSVTGNATEGTQFTPLWTDTSMNQPLTRDCTIITNGNNYLKVYLDGTMVYTNSTLNLQMPAPFNAFLEPQSSYNGQLLNGIYKDYYATSDENIKVGNLPSNAARVDLVDSTGTVLVTGKVSSGVVSLDVGKYHFPLACTIKVYDSNNVLIASTSGTANIYGGNAYAPS